MTLENKIGCVYAAKNFSEYLELTLPEPMTKKDHLVSDAKAFGEMVKYAVRNPLKFIMMNVHGMLTSGVHDLSDEKQKEQLEKNKEYDEKQDKYLEDNGLVTLGQKASWYAAFNTGRYLLRRVYGEKDRNIQVDSDSFEEIIGFGVREGVRSIRTIFRGLYLPPSKGKIGVNEDFNEKAGRWLCDETYRRLDGDKEIVLLDKITVKQKDNVFCLTIYEVD